MQAHKLPKYLNEQKSKAQKRYLSIVSHNHRIHNRKKNHTNCTLAGKGGG